MRTTIETIRLQRGGRDRAAIAATSPSRVHAKLLVTEVARLRGLRGLNKWISASVMLQPRLVAAMNECVAWLAQVASSRSATCTSRYCRRTPDSFTGRQRSQSEINAASMSSIIASEWPGLGVTLNRSVPRGTVG